MSQRDSCWEVCNLPSMTSATTRSPAERREGFLKQFLSHVALGRFGPIVKCFFVCLFVFLRSELYTLICLCKNTFILLSFEVWVKIIHVMNVVLCIFYVLQHLSTWLRVTSDGRQS